MYSLGCEAIIFFNQCCTLPILLAWSTNENSIALKGLLIYYHSQFWNEQKDITTTRQMSTITTQNNTVFSHHASLTRLRNHVTICRLHGAQSDGEIAHASRQCRLLMPLHSKRPNTDRADQLSGLSGLSVCRSVWSVGLSGLSGLSVCPVCLSVGLSGLSGLSGPVCRSVRLSVCPVCRSVWSV